MTISIFFEKLVFKLRFKVIRITRNTIFYPFIYRSYWHFLFNQNKTGSNEFCYYTAQPNKNAGIGHQMANWIAGFWYAGQFGLKFANMSFSSEKWESFLGFGNDEISFLELERKGYKKVVLPLFDEFNENEVSLNKKIIASYFDQKVVFIAEQDQFYTDQFGIIDVLKRKFYTAPARIKDKLIFDDNFFNIAVHVRRGDIVIGQDNKNPNLLLRWQANDYFERVLANVLENLSTDKPISIYLFSQGKQDDFLEFEQFSNLYFCLDMNAQDSFLHMVNADLLITSKSSFSYKPALLNRGIKICPKDFWHKYPDTKDFILADNEGNFEIGNLK